MSSPRAFPGARASKARLGGAARLQLPPRRSIGHLVHTHPLINPSAGGMPPRRGVGHRGGALLGGAGGAPPGVALASPATPSFDVPTTPPLMTTLTDFTAARDEDVISEYDIEL